MAKPPIAKSTRPRNALRPPDGLKWCPDCRCFRPREDFWRHTKAKDGLAAYCKTHGSLRSQKYLNPEQTRAYRQRKENKEKHKIVERERRKRPELKSKEALRGVRRREQIKLQKRTAQSREKQYARVNAKYHADPTYRLRLLLARRLHHTITGHKGRKTFGDVIIEYTVEDLKRHLERQFVAGMTWNNYGRKWHIDHILPLRSFNIQGPDCPELKAAFALTNLRPLWAEDNVRKQAKRTLLL